MAELKRLDNIHPPIAPNHVSRTISIACLLAVEKEVQEILDLKFAEGSLNGPLRPRKIKESHPPNFLRALRPLVKEDQWSRSCGVVGGPRRASKTSLGCRSVQGHRPQIRPHVLGWCRHEARDSRHRRTNLARLPGRIIPDDEEGRHTNRGFMLTSQNKMSMTFPLRSQREPRSSARPRAERQWSWITTSTSNTTSSQVFFVAHRQLAAYQFPPAVQDRMEVIVFRYTDSKR